MVNLQTNPRKKTEYVIMVAVVDVKACVKVKTTTSGNFCASFWSCVLKSPSSALAFLSAILSASRGGGFAIP